RRLGREVDVRQDVLGRDALDVRDRRRRQRRPRDREGVAEDPRRRRARRARGARRGRVTPLEDAYAAALAAAIANDIQAVPPGGALVRVVLRWFDQDDPL